VIIGSLQTIFLKNMQDLNNKINEYETLRAGFMSIQHHDRNQNGVIVHQQPLLHSTHNTGSPSVKVALVNLALHDSALHHFSTIHSMLQNYTAPDFKDKVFFQDRTVSISGQKADSILSCSYSAIADRLITSFNHQDGENLSDWTAPQPKIHCRLHISYSTAAIQSTYTCSRPSRHSAPSQQGRHQGSIPTPSPSFSKYQRRLIPYHYQNSRGKLQSMAK
jgi:hypothetical protein